MLYIEVNKIEIIYDRVSYKDKYITNPYEKKATFLSSFT